MKKAKSLLSLILALALVTASLPMMFITAIAEDAGDTTTPTYWVSKASGSDTDNDGLSSDAPFATLEKAVATLVATHGADADGIVKLMDTAGDSGANTFTDSAAASAWAATMIQWDVKTEHTGTITFEGINEDGSCVLHHDATNNYLTGPTVFKNLTVANQYGVFATNGHDFTTKGVINYRGQSSSTAIFVTDNSLALTVEIMHRSLASIQRAGVVKFEHTGAKISFNPANDLWLDATEDTQYSTLPMGVDGEGNPLTHTVVFDSEVDLVRLKIGKRNDHRATHTVTVGTMNLIFNSGSESAKLRVNNSNDAAGRTSYTNLQIIFNNGGGMSEFGTYANDSYFYASKMWMIFSDETGGILMTTDEPGVYQVNSNKIAVATNAADESIVIRSEGGYLDLSEHTSSLSSTKTAGAYLASVDDAKAAAWTWNVTYEDAPTASFNVGLKENTITVEKTDAFSVDLKVGANNAEILNYASGEITVTYDTTYLIYKGIENGSSESGASVVVDDSTEGTLKIGFHGANRNLTDVLATLKFEAKSVETAADTPALITVTKAGVSTAENAAINDLEESDIVEGQTEVTITKQTFTVSGADEKFTMNPANGLVIEGGSITLTPKNPSYTYEITANGEEVTANVDGSFTISDINEDVTIVVVSETAKTFNVTISAGDLVLDTDYKDTAATATYLVDYTFKVKADKAADQTAGWTYTVSVTDGLTLVKGEEADGFVTYTVTGTTITKDFTITITKTDLGANQFAVTINNNAVTADKTVVNLNDSVTLTITTKPGYTYTVKYTMGDGEEVTITTEILAGAVTIEDVNGVINVTVTETMNRNLSATVYVESLNIWLVLNDVDKMAGQNVFTFNGVQMYWSEEYGAYAVVVFGEQPDLDAATLNVVTVTAETVIEISYDKDVNCTGVKDINDAQLVYNIYNGNYTATTENVTVRKLLEADVNASKTVNVQDAQAVVDGLFAANNG